MVYRDRPLARNLCRFLRNICILGCPYESDCSPFGRQQGESCVTATDAQGTARNGNHSDRVLRQRWRGTELVPRKRTRPVRDRKSTRLNSSHSQISYAVFCLKQNNADGSFTPIFPSTTALDAHP